MDIRKTVIRLKSNFILNKNKRKKWYAHEIDTLTASRLKAATWGVSYSVFDGEELLEASLISIRPVVNYINVIYQLQSWYGNPADSGLLPLLTNLKNKGLIDELAEFKPNLDLLPTRNEINKRNMGLKLAKQNGVTHFMCLDCDEMFVPTQVKDAQTFMVANQISHSYCAFFSYGPKVTHRLIEPLKIMPFFSRLSRFSTLKSRAKTPCRVDATKKMSTNIFSRHYVFDDALIMHHMCFVRRNISRKIENSSFAEGRERLEDGGQNSFHAIVPNRFNISF
ncbi:MAG: hypothetical protein ACRCTY_01895 [Candidatus Adiutrix sp.]